MIYNCSNFSLYGRNFFIFVTPYSYRRGTIDLSQEAFAIIADPNAGKVQVEYNR